MKQVYKSLIHGLAELPVAEQVVMLLRMAHFLERLYTWSMSHLEIIDSNKRTKITY